MTSTITNVVFDIGNVLIEWNPENLYRKLIPNDDERHEFLTTVCTPDWNVQQDLGRTWTEAVEVLLREFPEKTALIRAYSDRWHEMVPGPVREQRFFSPNLKRTKHRFMRSQTSLRRNSSNRKTVSIPENQLSGHRGLSGRAHP